MYAQNIQSARLNRQISDACRMDIGLSAAILQKPGMKLLLFTVLLWTCGVCRAQEDIGDGLENDREALLALKAGATDFGFSKMNTWKPAGNPCFPKPWRHVTCGAGRVTEINLANLEVIGVLPAKLRLASRLVSINLEGNRFTDSIPSAWADRTSFNSLRALNLANNELSGTLPNWNRPGAWRSLRTVDLSNNNLHGGLPASWLGRQRAIRNVQFLDLSRNMLGRSESGELLSAAEWCQSDALGSLQAGWCPSGNPVPGTAAGLVSLDLSENDLTGELPSRWPFMFPQLQYLMIHLNNLSKKDSDGLDLASELPATWTSESRRAFPSLSTLTLYPGNDYICSLPDVQGGFVDVNSDVSYLIADAWDGTYGTGNPRRCPTKYSSNNPVAGVTLSRDAAVWTLPTGMDAFKDIWGFRVAIAVEDREGETWGPLTRWNGVLLRSYMQNEDGFSSGEFAAQQLSCTAGTCTLDLKARADRPTYSYEISQAVVRVEVINLDGVRSSRVESRPLQLQ